MGTHAIEEAILTKPSAEVVPRHRAQRGPLAAARAGGVGTKQEGPLPAFPVVTRPALPGAGSGCARH
ncbi:hypothetical protein FAZ21_06420 [Chitiniphilus eburneus]|uniref:Uncharacterized protein n=1 Tax=Chitiniphilus eburneus TaxID=2571148 RepID=A0A4U0Q3B7_9NEIS|nr:hypothetical protein FAZ21_06420 [Chitiniphilus eburneus]